ncbi:MAG: Eco57I restriction-modification methylase domain-containing protein [Clostridium sp.]|uniref:HsdM family class I SAM-dependent methyltransferase n=1 Tax=Clostridium sp. TaxID=1506 RepID=UPI002A8ED750|nr:Eco57I restriction-modification methylase domain-containing protein [Clostridium sp.]MDY5097370.1 Eco57I restriction-modification methylase domain-containing protein [Clostridium sp.]
MATKMLIDAVSIVNNYLNQNYSNYEIQIIRKEIDTIINEPSNFDNKTDGLHSYEEVQDILSCINEKEEIRKNKGVYYTPSDVVNFILTNSVKLVSDKLKPNNLHVMDLNGVPYTTYCFEKSVYDPTCGAGVFLLAALEMKLDLLDLHCKDVTKAKIKKVAGTINGNDLNEDSIIISKLRLFLCVLHRYGVQKAVGLAKVLNLSFNNYDYVSTVPDPNMKYDIIIGNPPYVEDSKSDSVPSVKYGNIYANVLDNAAKQLNEGGVMGFIIPLSYVSTPRMKRIRDELYGSVPIQYILSYSDRPDCLFTSVHQKLCILFGRNSNTNKTIYTANYRYWYKEERYDLFNSAEIVKNNYPVDDYIPKLGTKADVSIYKKIQAKEHSLMNLIEDGCESFYLNMRAAFWIKAFLNPHPGSEYKEFKCLDTNYKNFCMCLLNSSLFWWFWICISDCWHITRKELIGFKVPRNIEFEELNRLAQRLEDRLEETKLYVGTKQTEYEYKHKECTAVIHEIDDVINAMYGLSEEESLYIKNFAYRYRIGGGAENESN